MSGLFGGKAKQASGVTVASGLSIQSSVYGQVIPICFGTNRIGDNLTWYGDFTAVQQASQSGGGGKGGVGGGGGGKGGAGSGTYNYFAALCMAICEGPIYDVPTAYANKNITTPEALGFTVFDGSYPQAPWGYLTAQHPGEDLGYNGIAYVAVSGYPLGTSPQLPNHNFEVAGVLSQSILVNGAPIPDADPSLVLTDLLTNPHYGAGFPAGLIGDLSQLQNFSLAAGLWVSPFYTSQSQTSAMVDDLLKATNCALVWSSGKLNVYSYGDQTITNAAVQPAGASGPGVTYTAPSAPIYDLTDDDFVNNTATTTSSGSGTDPIVMTRMRPADAFNSIKIEYVDRNNSYNPAIAEAKDQASIDQFGLRQDSVRQMHLFADATAAQTSATLQLQRQQIRNQYSFTVDQRYILLDPMDIVTLTDARLGLNKHWVRITEITENDDYTLAMTAEDYLFGTGNAATQNFQTASGFNGNYNETAPNPNLPPIIFEPTAELAEELAVYMAISGPVTWGGAQVWISTDNVNYKLAGTITGSNRTGVLSASLADFALANPPPTIDTAHTLSVDLTQSAGILNSGQQADALNLSTLCYVDGEYIAYETATLNATNKYNLNYLVRGAYGSTIGAHLAGTQFARLDNQIFKYEYAANLIGTTIYVKFVSFNVYGGGLQTLSEVTPIAYTLQGTAYLSQLPDVQNVRTVYVGNLLQIAWDDIIDFRPLLYEIRRGDSWETGQFLGRVAHPPYNVPGDGTYWIAGYTNPVAGIVVYSDNPQQLVVIGSQLVSNVIATFDEGAESWPGEISGSVSISGGNLISTAGGSGIYEIAVGGFLAITDFLNVANVLTISSEVVNIGRVAPCGIIMTVNSGGINITDNILGVTSFLAITDLLDNAAGQYVNVTPQVAVSQDGVTFGPWQNYTPGFYLGMAFIGRILITSNNPLVQAVVFDFIFTVDVPDRVDHYMNLAVGTSGQTIVFTPDGSATPAVFNGGPNGAPLPLVQVTIMNGAQGDDYVLSGFSDSQLTITITNGGSPVARTVSVAVQGY